MTVDESASYTKENQTRQQVGLDTFMQNRLNSGEAVHVTRDLWYDNNTPAPVFDKNELGLERGGVGHSGITAEGNYQIIADMSADGSYHADQAANYLDLAREGKLKIAVSPTGGTQNTPLMVDMKVDMVPKIQKDGSTVMVEAVVADIPPSSPAGQFLVNENGTLQLNGRYAEIVQMGNVDNEGVQHIRPLATWVGRDIEVPLTDIVKTPEFHPITKITTSGYEGPGTFTEMAPTNFVNSRRAIEVARRASLRNPNIDTFYYGGGTLENMREWLKANPNRLQTRIRRVLENGDVRWFEADGSPVVRSVNRERKVLQQYLDNEKSKSPDHYSRVEAVAKDLGVMDDAARVAVNIPAFMEANILEDLLKGYIVQYDKAGAKLDPSLFEINILVNRKAGSPPDDSVAVIDKFITEFERDNGVKPRVNYSDVELAPPLNNVGYARKLVSDAVVYRSLQRSAQADPLYMESEDADLLNPDHKTVINLITKMDANPYLDAVRGVQDRSPEYMKQNDMLFLRRRAWDFFEIMARSSKFRNPSSPNWNFTWNRTVTGGWNTGYSAEAYALIEGYDIVPAGEDMSVGEKMTMMRGNGNIPNLEVIGTVSTRTDSSPRRFINEIATDKAAYADFTNAEDDKTIREKTLDELLESIDQFARINDSNKGAFEAYIKGTFDWAKAATPTPTDAEQFTRRLLFWLGFKKTDYEISGGQLNVRSWDNVKNALERYRARHP